MSLKILFRGRVLLAIIIFITITCTGIIYTSIKSLRLDREHLSLLELSKNIDLEISHSRIFLDDYFLLNDSLKKTTILNCFTKTSRYTISLDSLISEKYKGSREEYLRNSLEQVDSHVNKLQNKVAASLQNNAENFNVAILTEYRDFQLAYQELDRTIHEYILHENNEFRQRVFTLEVEYKERKRIAADLHDGLGSILSSIALFIKLIEKDCTHNKENKSLIQVKELSGIALENLEATINNLNPSILNKYGLLKSLEILCDKINDTGQVNCVVNSTNPEITLDPNMELNVYRICNELINNTLKHANASKLFFDIQQIKKTVVILYRDNGIGFSPELIHTSDEEKMGLRNIINRIESFGGKYEINTGEGKGVEIKLSFTI
jgi:signal transduction histidine kinase